MKTIVLKSPPPDLMQILDLARDDDLLLQLEDGREFTVTPVEDFDYEAALTRRNEKLMAFLDARAREKATIPHEQIERELGLIDPAESIDSQDN